MVTKRAVAAFMSAWVAMGCGASEQEELSPSPLATTEAELLVANGSQLNGSQLNGSQLNGPSLNQRLVSVRYDGVRHEGMSAPLDEVWLETSVFHGLIGSEELSGMDFLQMRFVGNLEDGTSLTLRVDAINPGTGDNQDVWSYRVSYQHTLDGQWYPICKNADGTPGNAIPLENRWDLRQGVNGGGGKLYDASAFTFACEGAALAKCVRFGYVPWRSVNGVSLEQHHQACTRMIRADFCGNGTSYTADGNWVNVYDSMSIQLDTEAWVPEAEWDSDGAICFSSQTRATTPISCGERLVTSCGTSFSPKTLLISETPPQP
jgi:hypothetical protein